MIRKMKSSTMMVSILLVICFVVSGTIAFLYDSSDVIENRFVPTQVSTEVGETLSGTTKSNVSIKNTGTTDAWIRATVLITWQNENGDVYATAPELDEDYTIVYGEGWIVGADGFRYYTAPVAAGKNTAVLIKSCTTVGNPPAKDYYLNVEILGSGIQSKPASVFNTEWSSSGLQVSDEGTSLVKPN